MLSVLSLLTVLVSDTVFLCLHTHEGGTWAVSISGKIKEYKVIHEDYFETEDKIICSLYDVC